MAEAIGPISAETRLAQLLGDDFLLEPSQVGAPVANPGAGQAVELTGSPFEDLLSSAIEALNGVSRQEVYADQVVNRYLDGKAELHEVMVAQSKMSIMVQLAVTTVNSAVATFKEITQMQI